MFIIAFVRKKFPPFGSFAGLPKPAFDPFAYVACPRSGGVELEGQRKLELELKGLLVSQTGRFSGLAAL